ncbi:FCD domain-containing protein [Paracidovorax citrulli]|uniref:Transcriptional regulator, GntR family n=2 Tax=Paracidovorax citrulli TaxID=80869 RepID=A1TTS0_PARC0|nr:FCD domain-containing protein [Paracidovorax citrulli]ABM34358.1 transcriptional regulator, GntR family [Paracidovorax citrulli AAC00-1]PVY63799.1 GntR family transcriptional regulator [Paracidovorax citrulli]REG67240.1 GntR family transcriptional regulator [Paracidovorax citrulli]RLJ91800.1 GntR family transcriptional regulator [Paracidovorax citrulli]UMT82188.1 FadR family transcriptional regulator [Paracidovorax citrulli]
MASVSKKQVSQRGPKRGDLVVEEIKRWITDRNLSPGEGLPKEAELQQLFGVGRGTMREALKALEVQGLIRLTTGPSGGAVIERVTFDRTFQFLQNYLFFEDITIGDMYALRTILEPEMAALAVPHLGEKEFDALERSIAMSDPREENIQPAAVQRIEDLHFHDILADACPNPLLRFQCRLINRMLETMVVSALHATQEEHRRLGEASWKAHRQILAAARDADVSQVRKLMLAHIVENQRHLDLLQSGLRRRLVLDSDLRLGGAPLPQVRPMRAPAPRTRKGA